MKNKMRINVKSSVLIALVLMFLFISSDSEFKLVSNAGEDVKISSFLPLTITDNGKVTLISGDSVEFRVNILPTNATNKVLEWSSSNETVAKVERNDSTGTFTVSADIIGVNAGEATITYKATDGSNKSGSFNVVVQPTVSKIDLDFSSLLLRPLEEGRKLIAEIYPSDAGNKTLNWHSSNDEICAVDYKGTLIPKKEGTCVITVMANDTSGTFASCLLVVAEKTYSISIDKTSEYILKGNMESVFSSIRTVTGFVYDYPLWKSSNPSVLSVDEMGNVKALKNGTATITATARDDKSKVASCVYTVVEIPEDIQMKTSTIGYIGKTTQLSVSFYPTSATQRDLRWSSSNTKVASVDQNGLVTGVSSGTALITATSAANSSVKATSTITIGVPVSSISLSATALTMEKTEVAKLDTTISPSNAMTKNVTWSSSNSSIAKVDQSGNITAIAGGTATITCQSVDGGYKANCKVTVLQEVTSIKFAKDEVELYVTQESVCLPTVYPTNATNKGLTFASSDTSIFKVSTSGNLVAVATGTATLTAKSKDGGFVDTIKVNVVPKISAKSFKLTRTTLPIYTNASYYLTSEFSPTNTSDKLVYFTSSNTSIATVDSNGKVTGIKYGTAVITATSRDGKFVSKCTVSVVLPVQSVKLSEANKYIQLGQSATLIATISPSNAYNKTVYWSSSNEKVCKVSSTGKITALTDGVAVITAKTGNGGYIAKCNVRVYVKLLNVTLNKTSFTLNNGSSYTLKPTYSPTSATYKDVVWKSDNSSIAKVDANGKVTALKKGTTTITMTTTVGGYVRKCTVTVLQPVTSMKLSATQVEVDIGKTRDLNHTIYPANANNQKVSWHTGNNKIVTISSTGLITAVGVGTVYVKCMSSNPDVYEYCKVTVVVPPSSIKLSSSAIALTIGKSQTLKATISPTSATNKTVIWKSSNTKVATVSTTGVVKAVGGGTATITASTYNSKLSAKCEVAVPTAPTGISLNKSYVGLENGMSSTITATVLPSTATDKRVKWYSSNTSIAKVDASGKVTAVGYGNATITAKTYDLKYSATCTISVIRHVSSVKLNLLSMNVAVGQSRTLIATISPVSATNQLVFWSSSNTGIATVDSDGNVVGVKKGSATITVRTFDGGYTSSCKVTVI